MRMPTESQITAAKQVEAHDPALLADCIDAARKAARQHRNADVVATYAATTVAACLPSMTYADEAERRRLIGYASRLAVSRAAADAAEEAGDDLSLDALADVEVIEAQQDPRLYRPAAPRPDAIAEQTDAETYAGAIRRLVDADTLAAVATLPEMDATERLAWLVRLSDLPHAGIYADALATYHARHTDAETGRPMRPRGRPMTLTGALAVATGRKANDRTLKADKARLEETAEDAAAALASALRDAWDTLPARPQRRWDDATEALADLAPLRTTTPHSPQTDVPVWEGHADAYTANRPPAPVGGKHAAPVPAPGTVVSIDTNTGHATADGRPLGHVGHPDTWERITYALATPAERTRRTKADAQPIGYAHDPACICSPVYCAVVPVYAETPAETRQRAALIGHAPQQRGPVVKPAKRRKSSGAGSTGPTVTAGRPAHDEDQEDAARRRAYAVD